ncbi:MAG: TOBE domain-containing protein [Leifsonia sp.]
MSEAAALLGVSDDTVRRWAEHGRLPISRNTAGVQVVQGVDLVPLVTELGAQSAVATAFPLAKASARNRFVGLVIAVRKDEVMAQVDLQAGPFRVVSLLSREAADELELEPGMLAVASAKATTVTIEPLGSAS